MEQSPFHLWSLRGRVLFVSELCGVESFSFLNSMEQSAVCFWTLFSRTLFLSSAEQTNLCFWTLCSIILFVSELCAAEWFLSLNPMEQGSFCLWTLWIRALFVSYPCGTESFSSLICLQHSSVCRWMILCPNPIIVHIGSKMCSQAIINKQLC